MMVICNNDNNYGRKYDNGDDGNDNASPYVL